MTPEQVKIILSAEDKTAAAFASARTAVGKLGGDFDSLGKRAVASLAGIASISALGKIVTETANYADEIGKLAQRAGTSSEEVSKLAYAARQADVDNAQLAKGLRALGEDALTGGKKLAELGIKTTDASGKAKGSAQLFGEVADAISRITDPQEKAAAAAELLGSKLGPELIPLLNLGAAGLKDAADEAQRFGRVVGDDAAKAAEAFNDNLTKLQEAGAGLAANIGNAVIPSVNDLIVEFNAGIQAAGGFWKALSLATINPFRDASENIKVLRDDLKGLQADRERYTKANSDTRAIDDAIKTTETKLKYLTTLQNQAQASRVVYSADDQSLSEAKRLGLAAATRIPSAPPAIKSSGGGKSSVDKSLSDYQRLLDDYAQAEDQNRMKVIRDRIKQEEADLAASLSASRQPAIDELETLEARNVAYQDWLKNLQDQTPTAQLEAQRQAMADLAAEYERGTFGAAGSAEAIAKYGETVNTYLRNVEAGVKQVNATADAAGSIFGSWLDKAITDGAKLSDVINGLINDLVRLAIQKAVIEPAAAGFTTFVGGLLGGTASFDGGGYTGSGARSGGVDGKGGFPAILHPNETVIDHTKGQSMGGSVNVSYTIDARGADPGSEMRIRQAIKESEARTKNDILASMNKGGLFAKASGRA